MKILFTIFFSLFFISSFSQRALDRFINASNLKSANISILVKELNSGKIIYEHRSEKKTTPASTTKLVSTATALEILGPSFTFKTKVQYDGKIINNVLEGNLYILGSGDPTLGSKHFAEKDFLRNWANAVKQLGIEKITGKVIADASIYSKEGIPPKWTWEDIGNYYAAGTYGISAYDNLYKLSLKSGEVGSTPEIIHIEPSLPKLNFDLELKAFKKNKDSAYIYGAPLDNHRIIYGAIPSNRNAFVIKGDIPNPPLFLAELFTQELKNLEINISQQAQATFIPNKNKKTTFYIEESPPLKEIIANINHKSNNHYAEHLFRQISTHSKAPASLNSSIYLTKKHWGNKGLDTSQLVIYDGCGLSPSNAISAKFFVDLLSSEYKSKNSDIFISSLAVAGRNGTLKRFLKHTQLEGKVFAKSGSIRSVQCFSGYIMGENDKQYAFAILVDNYSGIRRKVVKQIEQLLLSIE